MIQNHPADGAKLIIKSGIQLSPVPTASDALPAEPAPDSGGIAKNADGA